MDAGIVVGHFGSVVSFHLKEYIGVLDIPVYVDKEAVVLSVVGMEGYNTLLTAFDMIVLGPRVDMVRMILERDCMPSNMGLYNKYWDLVGFVHSQ